MTPGADLQVVPELLHELSGELAWHYRVFPFKLDGGVLYLYSSGIDHLKAGNEQIGIITDQTTQITDENDSLENETSDLQDELEIVLGRSVTLELRPADQISRLLNQYYLRETGSAESESLIHEPSSDDFLQKLIYEAKKLKSSDSHIEAYEEKCRIRIRIDGMLIERYKLNIAEYPSIINRIKILANLDIAEKRLPQDGRISFKS